MVKEKVSQKNERTLVLGDIHGCYHALLKLEEEVGFNETDKIILLGDYVDRGPQSSMVIEWILERRDQYNLITLCGNHEDMMTMSETDRTYYKSWLKYGGKETLLSYDVKAKRKTSIKESVPYRHWGFITDEVPDYFEDENYIYVHGGLMSDSEASEQSGEILKWMRFEEIEPHNSGKIVICGHTPQQGGLPRDVGHAICIDTGVYMPQGWLSCYEPKTRKLWQAQQNGNFREGLLPMPIMEEIQG